MIFLIRLRQLHSLIELFEMAEMLRLTALRPPKKSRFLECEKRGAKSGRFSNFSFSGLKPGARNLSWRNPFVTCDLGPAVAGPETTMTMGDYGWSMDLGDYGWSMNTGTSQGGVAVEYGRVLEYPKKRKNLRPQESPISSDKIMGDYVIFGTRV